ncbi:hypothetical protein M728_004831 (plasmid) [Ensifer sp. WSM1721]|uniref:hypothetical protein n=1 Tax=Ensifer sp. WSM1721 TaxID=1041159 RepID=UPI0012EBEEA9|nr:hypothetical protein [Ensifer sp. WSM1721]
MQKTSVLTQVKPFSGYALDIAGNSHRLRDLAPLTPISSDKELWAPAAVSMV